eukprot:191185_1
MSDSCSTDSLLPTWVTIGFICASLVILVFVAIHSVKILKRRLSSTWSSLSTKKKFKLWASDVWSRKAVYLPLVAHFSDTATDFAAIIEFYNIAHTYRECDGLNMWYLFGLSIVCMALYRLISALTIWRITHSAYRVLLQLLDLELFEVLYISHWLGLKAKSSPQRLISTLEAVFEASPQTVIQIIYLIKTRNFSPIIIISTVLSLISLSMTIISDDKKFLEIQFANPCRKNKRDWSNNLTKEAGCYKFGKFVMLHLFRVFNIVSQILFYIFVWYYINGYVVCGVLVLDVGVAVFCYIKTKNTDALMSIVALPFSFGPDDDDQPQSVLVPFWVYSLLRMIALNTTIWIFIGVNGFGDQLFVTVLWWFCFFASVATWILKLILHCFYSVGEYAALSKERSEDVTKLIEAKLYSDALEIMFYQNMNIEAHYKKQYAIDVSSRVYQVSLLGLAIQADNIELFQSILDEEGIDNDKTCEETALMLAARLKGKHPYIERIFDCSKKVDKEYVFKLGEEQKSNQPHALRIAFQARNMDAFRMILHAIFVDEKYNEMAYRDTSVWTIQDKDFSLLALTACQYINGSSELFEAILKHGLDTHLKDNKGSYWTAFGVCVNRCKPKFVEALMGAQEMTMNYMSKTMHVGETLLSLAITNCKEDKFGKDGEQVLGLILSKMDELLANDPDKDVKKVKWLNNAKPKKKQNALHCVCYQWLPVSVFSKLFEFYPKAARRAAVNAKDYDIGRNKNKSRSVREYVNEKENNKYSSTASDKRRIDFKTSTRSYINNNL